MEVVTDIPVVEVHTTVALGMVPVVVDLVCCTEAGHKTVEVGFVGSRHTAALEVVGRILVAVVHHNLAAVVVDMAQVVRTVLGAAAPLRFARTVGTSSLLFGD
jgi:hypothetical protein